MYVVKRDQLPSPDSFAGEDHGGLGVSFLYVDAQPGEGPALHNIRMRKSSSCWKANPCSLQEMRNGS
jgi:hypothetical protein